MNIGQPYIIKPDDKPDDLRYFFLSEGEVVIPKAIQYSYAQDFNNKRVFNLGFGNYIIEEDDIIDDINTNNNDVYKVFYTVLSTIPLFFEKYPEAIIAVMGSDGTPKFLEKCKSECKRNCKELCRKFNQRLNIYMGYRNKNFTDLSNDYQFFGGIPNADGTTTMSHYVPNKTYKAVMLFKK